MGCRNCRKRPHNKDSSPKRPVRGSIRKQKRLEMRRKKKSAIEKTHKRSVELSSGKTISESVMSVI